MSWLKAHKNDVLLVLTLLAAGGALALWLAVSRQAGGIVRVQADGEWFMELPLREDARVVLGSGERTNTLVVENGSARVIEASCPDQICVRQGAIRYEGQSIVCLPHRLVITVEGGRSGDVDATAK